MSAARSYCSLNALLTVACGPCVAGGERGLEWGRAGTGMEGRGKRNGDCHAGYIDCSNRLKVLALSRCRARLQQKSFFTRDA